MAKISNNQPAVPFNASTLKKAVVSRNKKLADSNKNLEAKIKELKAEQKQLKKTYTLNVLIVKEYSMNLNLLEKN